MRITGILLLFFACSRLCAQFSIPSYTILENTEHSVVIILADKSEMTRIHDRRGTDTLIEILPDIRVRNGIVQYKGLTGEIYVRKCFVDSALMGYIEYDGKDMEREIYYNENGDVFLEKQYKKGDLVYTNDKIQKTNHRNVPVKK